MQIAREKLASLIPHAGDMCLLDGVLEWDDDQIVCVSGTHRNPGNPLRRGGLLHAVCGVEYAAQAMATHAVLAAGGKTQPTQGYLASIRDFHAIISRLDSVTGDLVVKAQKSMCMEQRVLYEFSILSDGQTLIQGRLAAVLQRIAP